MDLVQYNNTFIESGKEGRYMIYKYELVLDKMPEKEGLLICEKSKCKTYLLNVAVPIKLSVETDVELSGLSKNINGKSMIKLESYYEYLLFRKKIDRSGSSWVRDILESVREVENVIYRDAEFVIVENIKWHDKENINNLACLGLVKREDLLCLRDLNKEHLPLLKNLLRGVEIVSAHYKIAGDQIRTFIHYRPSTWHLHIHYVNIHTANVGNMIESSHLLQNVIHNITLDSDYYKKIKLSVFE